MFFIAIVIILWQHKLMKLRLRVNDERLILYLAIKLAALVFVKVEDAESQL